MLSSNQYFKNQYVASNVVSEKDRCGYKHWWWKNCKNLVIFWTDLHLHDFAHYHHFIVVFSGWEGDLQGSENVFSQLFKPLSVSRLNFFTGNFIYTFSASEKANDIFKTVLIFLFPKLTIAIDFLEVTKCRLPAIQNI